MEAAWPYLDNQFDLSPLQIEIPSPSPILNKGYQF